MQEEILSPRLLSWFDFVDCNTGRDTFSSASFFRDFFSEISTHTHLLGFKNLKPNFCFPEEMRKTAARLTSSAVDLVRLSFIFIINFNLLFGSTKSVLLFV